MFKVGGCLSYKVIFFTETASPPFGSFCKLLINSIIISIKGCNNSKDVHSVSSEYGDLMYPFEII